MTLLHPTSTLFPYTTLFRSAQGLSADQVSRLNGIAANAELQPGQEIKLPIIRTELGSLRSEYVKSTQDYKASLQKLLTLYEQRSKSTRLNSSHANISYAVFC